MRKFGLKLLHWKLKIISILFLWRYKPKIIGITGSVGKSSTKEAIYIVLKNRFNVRRSAGSYNNEIGVPLTIIGEESPGPSIWGWIKLLFGAVARLVYQKNYPQTFPFETGVDKPNDIDYLTNFIKPKISVITSIGATHLLQLGSEKEVFREKSKLAYATLKKGAVVLNIDDIRLRELGLKIKRKVLFYGLDSQANIYASDIKYSAEGVCFNLHYAGNMIPTSMPVFGEPQIYAALAAAAVASILKMDLISITKALCNYRGLKGRLKLFTGKNDSYILDDSYNSNPMSADASLQTALKIKEVIGAQRMVVILGDMLELGRISRRAHINLGRAAARIAEVVIAVGAEGRAIEEDACQIHLVKSQRRWDARRGEQFNRVKSDNILWFKDSIQAAKKIPSIIKPNDLVLIKGSQGVRMERVSLALLKNKSDKKHLSRMSGLWVGK